MIDKSDEINHLIRNKIVCIEGILKMLELELGDLRRKLEELKEECDGQQKPV